MLAERTGADPRVVAEVDRAHRLAQRPALTRAAPSVRCAATPLPGPERLPALVDDAGRAHGLRATLRVDGTPARSRPTPASPSIAPPRRR